MGYWMERLKAAKLAIDGPQKRFGEETISFHDHDGLPLELVANPDARTGSVEGHGVTLSVEVHEKTSAVLAGLLGFRGTKECGNRFRYEAGRGGSGAVVDVEWVPGLTQGEVAVGTVHHVAWRTPNEVEQREWRREIAARGFRVTPVVDRRFFRSIYFREPGGVLFEIATDGPGFAVDEPADSAAKKSPRRANGSSASPSQAQHPGECLEIGPAETDQLGVRRAGSARHIVERHFEDSPALAVDQHQDLFQHIEVPGMQVELLQGVLPVEPKTARKIANRET
jgi:catechol 2,3-dioxygenase-like lactoylglutathione lyase family enzyme